MLEHLFKHGCQSEDLNSVQATDREAITLMDAVLEKSCNGSRSVVGNRFSRT